MSFKRTELVRFQHCDAAGIVFYPRYVEMVNATIEDFFAACVGHSFAEIHGPMNAAVPVAALTMEFKTPSRLGETLGFELLVTGIGRSSMNVELTCCHDSSVRFTARLTLVHISKTDYRAHPWPDRMRSRLLCELTEPHGSEAVRQPG
jgi:4-hydroxybenzoyl-CoA thioesterase